jgi:hypothetical protein
MTNIRTKPTKQIRAEQIRAKKIFVISTGAADGLIVRCAVERPPHFAFVFAGSLCCLAQTPSVLALI